jgi:hypothetical protein
MSNGKKRLNEELIAKLNTRHSIDQTAVNIVFQNATEDVDKTEIELFRSVGRIDKGILQEVIKRDYLDKFTVNDNSGFKSIRDLQSGLYSYRLTQFGKDGKEVVTTDYINFQVK